MIGHPCRLPAKPGSSPLTSAVVAVSWRFVRDQLREGTWIVRVPDRVHDVAARRKERAFTREQGVVALVDPPQAVADRARARGLSDRLAVREPRQVDAARRGERGPL